MPRSVGLTRKGEAQISLQPQTFRHALGLEEIGESQANHLAFSLGESVEKIAERACLRPFEQGVRVAMRVNQRPQVAAIVDEAGFGKQLFQLVIADAEDRVGFGVAVTKTDLLDGFAQQGAGFVRP